MKRCECEAVYVLTPAAITDDDVDNHHAVLQTKTFSFFIISQHQPTDMMKSAAASLLNDTISLVQLARSRIDACRTCVATLSWLFFV